MNFIEYWKMMRDRFDKYLLDELSTLPFNDEFKTYFDGGKRLRPILTILVCQSLGGGFENAIDFALAVELVHNSMLIHDDFIDSHTHRRGHESLWRKLNPRRAVLVADMILSYAQRKIAKISAIGYTTLAKAIYDVTLGAAMEPFNISHFIESFKEGSINTKFYRFLIRLKTAALFAASAKLGAIAAKKDRNIRSKAYMYGLYIGEAFQVADDLVDVYRLRNGGFDDTVLIRLIPAYVYFSKSVSLDVNNLDNDVIIDGMKKLINEAIENALKQLKNWPNNEYTSILAEAPKTITELMLQESS